MLLGNFFTISEKKVTGTNVHVTIDINALHPVFEGHFPGHPVVPGVCMMQMIKEILETVIEKKTQVKKTDQMKFLAIINPLENPTIQVEFTYDNNEAPDINVTGRLYKNEITFLKFRGSFVVQNKTI